MPDYYVGLISGTSMDGIDTVLASFDDTSVDIAATHTHPYPTELRQTLTHASREPDNCTVDDIGKLDRQVGACFRDAAIALLNHAKIDSSDVLAIGSHGQTLRHRPDAEPPFTLQIGNPAIIATGTGVTTVADFRQADMALGGQGAPLVPPFHEWLFRKPDVDRAVLNIGGIANLTLLPTHGDVSGFDTGPGNTLMDAWILRTLGKAFDESGTWAASGLVDPKLLDKLLKDPYFKATPPKSTGFEYFNLHWLGNADIHTCNPADIQATLLELTASSIAMALHSFAPNTEEVLICGGGIHNAALRQRLDKSLTQVAVASTASAGLDPDWVEATAFACLAMRTLTGQTGNLPSVTGATRAAILGAIYPA